MLLLLAGYGVAVIPVVTTPATRTHTPAADPRAYRFPAEDRTVTPLEDRTYTPER